MADNTIKIYGELESVTSEKVIADISQIRNGVSVDTLGKSGFYSKPTMGIPESDLEKDIIDSLNKANNALPITGGKMTGALILYGDPGTDYTAATKKYVDDMVSTATVGGYIKPVTGIPKTDLASAVQSSLNKADSAVQPDALADVATSGSYNDLNNTPAIPTIPNITVTPSGNGNAITAITPNGHTLTVTKGEIFAKQLDLTTLSGRVSTVEGKIPIQASATNQIADKAFVNSTVQTATANFRGNWDSWVKVPTNADSYPTDYAGGTTPTVNDYLVVQDASDYLDQTLTGTWRFKYSGTWAANGQSGWKPEYQVNETPLTAAQLAALNSGATVALVGQITTNKNDITAIKTKNTEQDTAIKNVSEIANTAVQSAIGLSGIKASILGTEITITGITANTSTLGVAYLYKASDCSTYSSDNGGATPAAVKKAITTEGSQPNEIFNATTTHRGTMSKEDKLKLDAFDTADHYLLRSGGTMTGEIAFEAGSIGHNSSPLSFVVLDKVLDGGKMKYATVSDVTTALGVYKKPSTGIPATDLSQDVQDALKGGSGVKSIKPSVSGASAMTGDIVIKGSGGTQLTQQGQELTISTPYAVRIRTNSSSYMTGDITIKGGDNVTVSQRSNEITISATGGGGGGGEPSYKVYNHIISNQDEFDDFVNNSMDESSYWGDILICNGTYELDLNAHNGLYFNEYINSITGVGAVINITNCYTFQAEKMFVIGWYEKEAENFGSMGNRRHHTIRGLTIRGNNDPTFATSNIAWIFGNCFGISDCEIYGSFFCGFTTCDNVTDCKYYLPFQHETSESVSLRIYEDCDNLTNCYVINYEFANGKVVAYSMCRNMNNCIVLLSIDWSREFGGYFDYICYIETGFQNCEFLNNCHVVYETRYTEYQLNSYSRLGRGFLNCKDLTNCSVKPSSLSPTYMTLQIDNEAFKNNSHLSNCRVVVFNPEEDPYEENYSSIGRVPCAFNGGRNYTNCSTAYVEVGFDGCYGMTNCEASSCNISNMQNCGRIDSDTCSFG